MNTDTKKIEEDGFHEITSTEYRLIHDNIDLRCQLVLARVALFFCALAVFWIVYRRDAN